AGHGGRGLRADGCQRRPGGGDGAADDPRMAGWPGRPVPGLEACRCHVGRHGTGAGDDLAEGPGPGSPALTPFRSVQVSPMGNGGGMRTAAGSRFCGVAWSHSRWVMRPVRIRTTVYVEAVP